MSTSKPTLAPFAKPLYLMAKAGGAQCNLACDYCYYLEKAHLYADNPQQAMDERTLEAYIKQYIEAQTTPSVLFTWHGGEPMLRSLDFYKKALALQQRYANGRTIENCIQTNGTLITEAWAQFLAEHHWLVGISIDGPAEWHDTYRRALYKQGQLVGSHRKVMRGLDLLKRHGVAWNAMAVVNRLNADHPERFYQYFKDLGCEYLQFSPIVERITTHSDGRHLAAVEDAGEGVTLAPFSITPEQWGHFLCGVWDAWMREDVGRVFVQLFDSTLANWVGVEPGLCTMARACGHAAVMEHNGDVYACDHYVFPQYKVGNIHERTITNMMYDASQQQFGRNKYERLTQQCRDCHYLFTCWGECPRNRFVQSHTGEHGHNYLCEGYYRFFHHVAPYMDYMKHQLHHGLPPADVMRAKADIDKRAGRG